LKNTSRLLGLSLASAVLLAGCGVGNSPRPVAASVHGKVYFQPSDFTAAGVSKKQIVVKLAGRGLPQSLSRQGAGAPTVTGKINALQTMVVDVGAGQDLAALLKDLRADKAVAYAEPLQRVELEKDVNDPKAGQQYSLKVSHTVEAWDTQMGAPSVIVAIIDSGVDMNHPDLKAKIVPQSYNVLDHSNKPMDDLGHGTHCAGIAAAIADNAEGVAGVAPGVGLMSVKVLDARGGGSDATIAEGIVYAADHGAKVASMSLGLYKHSKVIEDALQYALDHDVVLVASAGNNNKENDPVSAPHLPSTYPGVIEVAATDAKDAKATFSNIGKTVTVAAPGVDILSTMPTYNVGRTLNYGLMSGTSMASPFVAGLAGLVRSQYPNLTNKEVRAKIEAAADDLGTKGFDTVYGHGRVNAQAAVN
jgi:subtilisin family serine protease